MFDRTADIYDLAYAHKDYGTESIWVRDAVLARTPNARTLLDVACGTGKHLEYLRNDFDCQGLELNEQLVAIAKGRTGLEIHHDDMDSFDLGQCFDAVVCLFSSIGYSTDLPGAVLSMAKHVAPGGVLIIEPWFTPDQWIPGSTQVLDHEEDGRRLVRVTLSGIDQGISTMEMHHLIVTQSGIEHRVETHRMQLFTRDQYEEAFTAAGLSYEVDEPGPFGRGALIGRSIR